jgi:hypothetical protein
VSDFHNELIGLPLSLQRAGAPGRLPAGGAQAAGVVCAAATLDDPATRIENQLVESKWAC